MDVSAVAPELRKPLRRLPRIAFSSGLVRWLMNMMLSRVPAVRMDGVSLEVRRDVGAGLRIYRPKMRKSRGVLLWMHGGGFLIGSAVQDDRFCASTARDLGIVVVSIEYRLAPRHRFPAALDDAFAAWTWLQSAAVELEIDPAKVAIGGQSAGGGLAAGLVQRVQDASPVPAAAQWLFCPMLDDRTAAQRQLDGVGHFLWTNRNNAYAWRAYLGVEPGAPVLPLFAAPARRERLEGLPPAWIGVGEIDIFLEEDLLYAERLRAAGVAATLTTIPGAPHGFEAWAPRSPQAAALIAAGQAWLGAALSQAPGASTSGGRRGEAVGAINAPGGLH